jgi:type I restriction enzyme S subunit
MIISPFIQGQAVSGIRGSGMADLGLKTIRQFQVPVPPLKEQGQIVGYLDGHQANVNSLKKLQAETSKELDALMPFILSRAFSGGV